MVSVNGDRGGFLFVLVDGWRGGCCGGFVIGIRGGDVDFEVGFS